MEFTRPITPFMPLAEKWHLLPSGESSAAFEAIAGKAEFFDSGRGGLLRALKLGALRALESQQIDNKLNATTARNASALDSWRGRIFLPSYFCPWIIKLVEYHWGGRVFFYDDFPSEAEPRFNSLKAAGGDIVVAVNFFGARDFGAWEKWRAENSQVIFIKDVSHTPFLKDASGAEADFTFASLRKTLPVCDGGFLRGKCLQPAKVYQNSGELSDFAAAYLDAAAIERLNYPLARDFYYNAEMRLNAKRNVSRVCAYSYNFLKIANLEAIWRRRFENFDVVRQSLSGRDLPFRLLVPPPALRGDKFAYFCPTFCFDRVENRDKYYAKLAENGMLPSIYWGAKFLKSAAAKAESARFMTVSLDFRHTAADAQKFAELMLKIK